MKFRSLILVLIIVCLVAAKKNGKKHKNGNRNGGHGGQHERGGKAHQKGKGAHEEGDGCDQEENDSTISDDTYYWEIDWEMPVEMPVEGTRDLYEESWDWDLQGKGSAISDGDDNLDIYWYDYMVFYGENDVGESWGDPMGFNEGYDVGESWGEPMGFNEGYDVGESWGEPMGFNEGYDVKETWSWYMDPEDETWDLYSDYSGYRWDSESPSLGSDDDSEDWNFYADSNGEIWIAGSTGDDYGKWNWYFDDDLEFLEENWNWDSSKDDDLNSKGGDWYWDLESEVEKWDSDSDLEEETWSWDEIYSGWEDTMEWGSDNTSQYSFWGASARSDSTYGDLDQDPESYSEDNWDWDFAEYSSVLMTGLEEVTNISLGDLIPPVLYDALKALVEGETNFLWELLDSEIDWEHLIGKELTSGALISDWQELGEEWNDVVAAALDNKDELIEYVKIYLSQRNDLEHIIQQNAFIIFEKIEHLVDGQGKLNINVDAPASDNTGLPYDSKHEKTYDDVGPALDFYKPHVDSLHEKANMAYPNVTSRSTATVLVDLEDLLKLMSVNADVMPREEIYTLQNLKELLSTVKEADSVFGDDRTWMCRVLSEESMLKALGGLAAGDDQGMAAGQGVGVPTDPVRLQTDPSEVPAVPVKRPLFLVDVVYDPVEVKVDPVKGPDGPVKIPTGSVIENVPESIYKRSTYVYQADNIQTEIVMAQPFKAEGAESEPMSSAESEQEGSDEGYIAIQIGDVAAEYLPTRVMKPGVQWRDDLRCGPLNPLPNGAPAQCDPHNANGNTCCSTYGWCGNTSEYCKCEGCLDYSAGIAGGGRHVQQIMYRRLFLSLLGEMCGMDLLGKTKPADL